VNEGAVTAAAADSECLGPQATVRVGRQASASAGCDREAPLARRRQPPLMSASASHLAAISLVLTFGGGLSTVLWMERESNPRQTTVQVVALPD
jgi:hypothetical protein